MDRLKRRGACVRSRPSGPSPSPRDHPPAPTRRGPMNRIPDPAGCSELRMELRTAQTFPPTPLSQSHRDGHDAVVRAEYAADQAPLLAIGSLVDVRFVGGSLETAVDARGLS